MHKIKALWASLTLIFFGVQLSAQQGHYLQDHYSPKNYRLHPLFWSMGQDTMGRLYLSNNDGLVRFDGRNWHLHNMPGIARGLSLDHEGQVFVGLKGDAGYMAPGANGGLAFRSVLNSKLQKQLATTEFNTVYVVGNIIFYVGDSVVLTASRTGKDRNAELMPMPGLIGHGVLNGTFCVNLYGKGLHIVSGRSVRPVPGGELFADKEIAAILKVGATESIIATSYDGLFSYKNNNFERLTTDIDRTITSGDNNSVIYDGVVLPGGSFALALKNGGTYLLSRKGEVIYHFSEKTGLPSNSMYRLFADRNGSLWIAHSQGLSVAYTNTPLRKFDRQDGLKGKITDVLEVGGKAYLASITGAYTLSQGSISPISGIADECWAVRRLGDKVYIAGNEGLFEIDGNRARNVYNKARATSLVADASTGSLFVGTENGIVQFKGGEIKSITDDNFNQTIVSLQLAGNKLVAAGTMGQVFVLSLGSTAVQTLGKDKGVPAGNLLLFKAGNDILLQATGKVYKFTGDKFVLEDGMNGLTSSGSLTIYPGIDNRIWISSAEGIRPAQYDGKSIRFFPTSPLNLLRERVSAFDESGGRQLFAIGEQLFVYESGSGTPPPPFTTRISSITAGKKALPVYQGYFWNDDSSMAPSQTTLFQPSLSWGDRALKIRLGSSSLLLPGQILYSWKLSTSRENNNEGDWSEWSPEAEISLNNLSEGTYFLYARAQDGSGQESQAVEYVFRILPPWYRSIWAYLLYAVLLAGAAVGGAYLYGLRLKRQNEKLELVVQERTAEVVRQKDEIEKAKSQVEEVNKSMTDSIKYATRIQGALLKPLPLLKNQFPDSFLIYKPKDILSGDFYWLHNSADSFYFAVADCTGHGVPGALLTVLCMSFLDSAIGEMGLKHPNEILHYIDDKLIERLRTQADHMDDGMDIALCRYDKATNTLEFSGSQRPLVIHAEGKLTEIPGERYPIGGSVMHTEQVDFKLHKIAITPGTKVLLYSDGITDQYGGEKGRKYSSKRYLEQFEINAHQPLEMIQRNMEREFNMWKGDAGQTDDVTALLVRFS